jgi:ATP-dependent helicase HepA
MFSSGQRWYSEGEPELGLGVLLEFEGKRVTLNFPLSDETRTYGIQSSPLKRFSLKEGDSLTTVDGSSYKIDQVEENNGVIFYICGEKIVPELDLSPKIDLNGPLDRILLKNFDTPEFFSLRYQSYLEKRHYHSFTQKGFLGPKIRLIPHQVYVVNEVLKMDQPRAMLCDEVGLGKTIEAALILNSLLQKELAENVLIVVPESLVNQWFVELYKKFNLSFQTIHNESQEIDFEEAQKLIVSSNIFNNSPEIRESISNKNWDMLIIDESHQIDFSQRAISPIKEYIEIRDKTYSTILLSATPEVLGVQNLFEQLHFLDPNKYNSFEEFSKVVKESQKISQIIKLPNLKNEYTHLEKYFSQEEFNSFNDHEEIVQTLIDRFGTGRNYFRNSRSNLENYSRLFNERVLHPYPLEITGKITDKEVFNAKALTVLEIIKKYPDNKILVLCHSKVIVLKLIQELKLIENFKIATFHSDQSLMERDRQAAYFADDEGANILVSTEVGSEGRNFEFSSHLILFDLPKLPDQLEQRIGRLDRIGQENNINVHIPYIQNTFEDTMFRWYNNVFEAFTSSPKGANSFYEQHHHTFKNLLESQFQEEKISEFITVMKSEYLKLKESLEKGRDLIIETHSYNDVKAKSIIKEIHSYQEKNTPHSFLDSVFNAIGVSYEELNEQVYFIKATDNMLIPSFPGLGEDGISITYDRDFSLKFDNIALVSWEHPIVHACFELLLSSQLGNVAIIKQEEIPNNIFFEFIVTLQCVDEHKHISSTFLPFTPIRVLLSANGEDNTKKLPKKFLDTIQRPLGYDDAEILSKIPKDFLVNLFKVSQNTAQSKANKYQSDAAKEYQTKSNHEKNRIEQLKIQTKDKQILLNSLKKQEKQIVTSISDAKLSIDSVRIILPEN